MCSSTSCPFPTAQEHNTIILSVALKETMEDLRRIIQSQTKDMTPVAQQHLFGEHQKLSARS